MAITEPGCGSDPSKVQTTAVLDGDEWVINGEKIFVTTGCKAEGVVVWATIDKSAGPRGHQVVPDREGHARLRRRAQGEEARHPRRRHRGLRVQGLPDPAREPARRRRDDPEGELGRLQGRAQDLQHDAPRGGRGRARHGAGRARLHARSAARGGHRDRVRRPRAQPVGRGREVPRARGARSRRPSSRSCARRGSRARASPTTSRPRSARRRPAPWCAR